MRSWPYGLPPLRSRTSRHSVLEAGRQQVGRPVVPPRALFTRRTDLASAKTVISWPASCSPERAIRGAHEHPSRWRGDLRRQSSKRRDA